MFHGARYWKYVSFHRQEDFCLINKWWKMVEKHWNVFLIFSLAWFVFWRGWLTLNFFVSFLCEEGEDRRRQHLQLPLDALLLSDTNFIFNQTNPNCDKNFIAFPFFLLLLWCPIFLTICRQRFSPRKQSFAKKIIADPLKVSGVFVEKQSAPHQHQIKTIISELTARNCCKRKQSTLIVYLYEQNKKTFRNFHIALSVAGSYQWTFFYLVYHLQTLVR